MNDATSMADALIELAKVVVTGALPVAAGFLGIRWQAARDDRRTARQRREKLEDQQIESDRAEHLTEGRRAYTRALLARHLESYARECADVMGHNHSDELTGSKGVPPLKDWPPDVDWELLGADEMMRLRDIAVHVEMHREVTAGNVYFGGGHEDADRPYYAEGAAIVGSQAWRLAQQLRKDAKVSAFEFPDGVWDFAQAMDQHLAQIKDAKASRGSSDLLLD